MILYIILFIIISIILFIIKNIKNQTFIN